MVFYFPFGIHNSPLALHLDISTLRNNKYHEFLSTAITVIHSVLDFKNKILWYSNKLSFGIWSYFGHVKNTF